MRAVIQRVSQAAVSIDGMPSASIGTGLLVLLGVEVGDTAADVEWLAGKTVQLRIFPDADGKMNRDVRAIAGDLLVVSQFTLLGDARKGNRPSFMQAARPDEAIPLYESFLQALDVRTGRPPQRGVFAANMKVSLINDGPVTILLDSREE